MVAVMSWAARRTTGLARRRGSVKAALALVLAVVTVAFHQWDGRFALVRPGILANLDFAAGPRGWQTSGAGVRLPGARGRPLALETGAGQRLAVVGRYLRDPGRFRDIRVAVDLAAEGLVAGDQAWQRGGVILRAYGRDGHVLWYWPYVVTMIDGSRDWRRYQAVIPVGEAAAMQLFVYNAARSGRLLVRGIALDAVAESWWATAVWFGLAALWVAGGLWVALPLAAAWRRSWARAATLVVAAGITVGVLTPQPLLSDSIADLEAGLGTLAPPVVAPATPQAGAGGRAATGKGGDATTGKGGGATTGGGSAGSTGSATETRRAETPAQPLLGLEQRAHLAAFTLLAVLAGIAYRGAGRVVVYLLVTAVALEAVQAFVVTRTVDVADGGMNALGVALGSGLALALRLAAGSLKARRR